MKHVSTSTARNFLSYARRGALLLALGAAGPAAWGQSFGPASFYTTGANTSPYGATVGDVNGDGRPDIVVGSSTTDKVAVLLNQGGGFAPVSTYANGFTNIAPSSALGDVNGDGRLDIVTAQYQAGNVGVLLGQAGGSFGAVSSYSAGANMLPSVVAVGDVNGDGRLDIVTGNSANSSVGVLLGQSSGGFTTAATYSTGTATQPYNVILGDVNSDGRPDIVLTKYSASTVSVLLGLAGGGFGAVTNYATGTGSSPTGVVLGDVNGDGMPDIITTNYSSSTVGVLLGQAGGFGAAVNYPTGATGGTPSLALGDVTGDGRLDIIAANRSSGTIGVLPGLGGGTFGPASIYSTGTGSTPYGIALGDLNGDGRPDIVTTTVNGSSTVVILLNTGTYTPLATARPTAADFTLAPNPTHEAFTVQLPAGLTPTQAELLNVLGQVVRRPTVGGSSFKVETNGLAPGLYTLRLQAGDTVLAKRVVVE